MKITVMVKPNARKEKVEKIDEEHYRVWVKAIPRSGKANEAACMALSEYFHIKVSDVVLAGGGRSRRKVFYIKSVHGP